jgi:glutamine synthetase
MGNGAHIHFSLWKDGKNYMGNPSGKYELTEEAESFMAGILENYEALVHFMCPTPNSLRRFEGSSFVGTYKMWGIENKEAPIRLITPLRIQDRI